MKMYQDLKEQEAAAIRQTPPELEPKNGSKSNSLQGQPNNKNTQLGDD
jgi:hypothetical protein